MKAEIANVIQTGISTRELQRAQNQALPTLKSYTLLLAAVALDVVLVVEPVFLVDQALAADGDGLDDRWTPLAAAVRLQCEVRFHGGHHPIRALAIGATRTQHRETARPRHGVREFVG